MTTDELEGVVTVDGDRATLTFERRLKHPVERVWAAITEPAHRDIWMGKTVIDGRGVALVICTRRDTERNVSLQVGAQGWVDAGTRGEVSTKVAKALDEAFPELTK